MSQKIKGGTLETYDARVTVLTVKHPDRMRGYAHSAAVFHRGECVGQAVDVSVAGNELTCTIHWHTKPLPEPSRDAPYQVIATVELDEYDQPVLLTRLDLEIPAAQRAQQMAELAGVSPLAAAIAGAEAFIANARQYGLTDAQIRAAVDMREHDSRVRALVHLELGA
jgi:CDP-diacylglycerol pyrophosphatase